MTTPLTLGAGEARSRLHELTVIDVRTPGEYAGGHVPGALNIPLDQIRHALPDIRHAADRGDVLVVCASGARSETACRVLADNGIDTATLSGGTGAWAAAGHDLQRPQGGARATWGMERQVRFTAGTVVLLGLLLGVLLHPAFQILSAGIAAGLVFSALTNTCGMAAMLAKLPHNRPGRADLDDTLTRLRSR
ncbi:rhodanese-like domain-containing protein [Streptomyces zhihengii]|uniref:Rhodanese-like domain-containing protein n=1 Tax=Streptomyces zhihengii TaxID=1818004 RepID=A0ABS2V3L5_9ACTN|nr:rhodanese-like domain-containing protein [Streptomyces zhihengii]MBM9624254.1 rhodanese-like domain-containing protein [Streptomyces zhihengii]